MKRRSILAATATAPFTFGASLLYKTRALARLGSAAAAIVVREMAKIEAASRDPLR